MDIVDLDHHISALELHQKYLSEQQLSRLAHLVRVVSQGGDESNGVDGSIMPALMDEVQEQLTCVQGLRRRITERGDAASTRELKDMIQASTSLFSMLTKLNEDITNQDRLRKIENAVVEVIKTMDGKSQSLFFTTLEEALSA